MKLTFTKKEKDNKKIIEVSFNKKNLDFSLDSNNLTNDDIIQMLTEIAREISAKTFDPQKDIIEIDKNELGDIKDLYLFILSLFKGFIDKYIDESNQFEKTIAENERLYKNKINNSID